MASPELPVTPEVLLWARETAGYSIDEVAAKLVQVSKKIDVDTVADWENGDALPKLTALRKLANIYKRPMAVFFLSKPPAEPPPPKNFRLLAAGDERSLSPQTLLAVRTARRLHSLAREISDGLGYTLDVDLPHVDLSADPAQLAADERARLGATFEEQLRLKDAYKALWYWRDLIEDVGCFVFQLPFPREDARAFSEFHDDGPLIVLSTKDEAVGRVFSLFHEYAHLLLRAGGICPSFRLDYLSSVEGQIEQFCNAFAANFLVPAAQLESAAEDYPEPTEERSLVSLSYKFSVGKHVILRRFLDLDWVDQATYREKVAGWEKQWAKAKKPQGGPVRQEVKSISQRGRRFSSLIVEAADRGLIAPPTLYEGLGVRTKYLSDVRAQLTA
jgi:Zn-dependent peptidase ImmA (M78 family)/DNA-binding XRE family transcriptional regulator